MCDDLGKRHYSSIVEYFIFVFGQVEVACGSALGLRLRQILCVRVEGKDHVAGHFYLSKNKDEIFNNGAVMTLSKIITHVLASAPEEETAAFFYNFKSAIPLRLTLEEMRHPQPKTPVTSENTAALGLIKKTMIPKIPKSFDMRFNFLKCRQAQNQFTMLWRKGTSNRAAYHTKKHPTKHYVLKRGDYVVVMPQELKQ